MAQLMRGGRGQRLLLIGLSLAPALLAACSGATEFESETSAADYPRRPVTWIMAFDPGGGSDVEARRVQRALEEKLGTSIQVQYRSGGGGAVGWAELVNRRPDGYTVGGLVIPHVIMQPLALTAGYATEQIRSVAWTVTAPSALLVAEASRFKTIEEFVSYAREHPGRLTVGGVETFSASDLALAQLMASSGIEVDYVPIAGGAGPLLASLQGGHVDAGMLSTAHAVRTAGVRALAVAGTRRFERLPDVPTFAELGYEVTIEYAWGIGMPAGTPDAIAAKFGQAVIEVMKESGAAEAVLDEGLYPALIGPERAEQYVADQKTIYEKLMPLVTELSR